VSMPMPARPKRRRRADDECETERTRVLGRT
jgi:hypothetical protein